MTTALTTDNKSHWKLAFLLALGVAALIFLPFVIYDRGYFIYYGDFNVQQIPFYQLAHRAVRAGELGWNWYTDLGVNFIGSYSFYLLFSPFFWLTLPFPTEALPFLMAPLLVLKTACASLTAYLYLERFVRNRAYAVAGGLLYAFSGWMFFNIFFNHFHDVAVFFPLLLLAVELLVCENRKGLLAVVVALCAMVNYWFFVGEVVFVILYVFLRMTDPTWPMTWKKFIRLALESLLGVGLACAVMLPSVLAILGNPRTGADELVSGWGFWLYWHEQRQPAIVQSLFFPPELAARPNFFPDHGAKWASLSGWLPFFGMTGVLAYFFGRKNDWLKKLLALCLVMALVPGLNSLFVLLNNSYYARWFFMPLLLMALATIRALEDSVRTNTHFSRGILWSMIIVMAFVVMCGLTPNKNDDQWRLGMYEYLHVFWAYAVGAILLLALVAVLVLYLRKSRRFLAYTCTGIALVSVVFGIFYLANGKYNAERVSAFVDTSINGEEKISLPDGPFARTDFYEGSDNLGMYWQLPTIQAFHSIVPPSIMEFYPAVGVKRDVGSRPEIDYPALRPLLSVRWLFINQAKSEDESPMPGYEKYSAYEQTGYYVYENENYIPMGFGYQYYVTREQLEEVDKSYRGNLMLRAIVLEEEDIGRFDDMLTMLPTDGPMRFSTEDMALDSADRREQAAHSFVTDKRGFTAQSNLPQDTLLFFSVPYEEGWSATIGGEAAEIVRANVGFMAVRVPAGEADIRFDYQTPGLQTGLRISGGSLLALLIYLLLSHRIKKPESSAAGAEQSAQAVGPEYLSWNAYLSKYQNKQARGDRLRQTIDAAARKRVPTALPAEERTLRFNPPSADHTNKEERGEAPDRPAGP